MTNLLRLLILEDRPSDAELMLAELRAAGIEPDWKRVDTEADYLAALDPALDLILADYHLPQFDGVRALKLMQEHGLDIPFILVSGTVGEEIAVEAMKNGAADYMLKDRMTRLGQSVSRALEQKRLREEIKRAQESLRNNEDRYRDLVENSQDLICTHDLEGRILSSNPAATRLLGYELSELIGRNLRDIMAPEVRRHFKHYINRVKRNGSASGLMLVQTKNGEQRVWEYQNSLRTEGVPVPIVRGMARDVTERVQAAKELQKSEEKYRFLFENNPYPMWAYDLKTLAFLAVNDSAVEKYGYTRAEFLRMTIADIRPAEDVPHLMKHLAGQRPILQHAGEWRHRLKDGTVIDVEITSHSLRMDEFDAALVVAQDITERKRAEQALRIAEANYRSILENAPVGFFQTTQEGRFLAVNPSMARINGYASPEEMKDSITDIGRQVYADIADRVEFMRQMNEHGEVREFVNQNRRKDGSLIWVSTNARTVKDAEGNFLYYEGFITDVTERKQAEQELQNSEKRFRALIQNGRDNISLLAADGTLLWESPSTIRMMGYAPNQFAGRDMFELMHPDDQAWTREMFAQLIQTPGRSHDGVFRLRHGDGTWRWIESTATNLLNEPAVQAIVVNYRDITERKRAEEEIRRHLTELEVLYQNGLAISRLNDPREIGKRIIENFADHLSWHHVALRLRRGDSDDVELIAFNQPGMQEQESAAIEDHFNAKIQNVSQGLSGWVMQTGQAFRSGDVRAHPQYADTHSNIRSGLYVPLKIAERVIGSISVESESADAFSEQDERLLSTMANQAAIALENARLFHAVQKELEQRKQADEALQISETRFRALIERNADLIIVIDGEGIIKFVSPSAERILGYSSAESLGRNFLEWIHPEDMALALESLESRREIPGPAPAVIELRGLHKDGTWRTVDVLGTNLLAEPAVQGIVLNVRDITERKLAEVGLRQAEEKYRNIFDNAMEAITLTTPDGKFIDANPATARMLGYDSPEELIAGLNDLASQFYVQPGRRAEIERRLEEFDSVSGVESEVYRRDGSKIWISENSTAVPAEDGRLLRYEGTAIDITERKRAERQVTLQLQRLRALNDIDRAISSSIDMRVSLDILLSEVCSQLGVDAASVLLLNPSDLMLEYVAGKGFHTSAIRQSRVHLGDGYAGQAGLERRVIHVPNLLETGETFKRVELLKNEEFKEYFGVPLIAKGQLKGVLEIFNRSALTSDAEWAAFMETLGGQAAIAIDNSQMFEGLQQSHMELAVAYDATIEGWSRAMDLRDKETEGHTQRVTELTLQLAERMGLAGEQIIHIRRGALLHDIGKLGVPDHILLKPGKLTDEEWVIMRQHPTHALNMLMPIKYLQPALDIPYCHHEKWDGSGYPRGLKGEQIPLAARLFAVVDVWDALRSDRPYRPGWTAEQSRKHILEQSGKQFDPAIVEIFQTLIENE